MINQIYTHPHVNIAVDALLRTPAVPAESDATVLFVPFVSEKGSTELQKIYSLSQFINEYGEPNFETQGRTILNVYNWLQTGGAVYALRLSDSTALKASGTLGSPTIVTVVAKNPGTIYNQVSLSIAKSTYTGDFIDVNVFYGSKIVQKYTKLSASNISRVLTSSEYIGEFNFASGKTFADLLIELGNVTKTIELNGGDDNEYGFENLLKNFYNPDGSILSEINFTYEKSNLDPESPFVLKFNSPNNFRQGEKVSLIKTGQRPLDFEVYLVNNNNIQLLPIETPAVVGGLRAFSIDGDGTIIEKWPSDWQTSPTTYEIRSLEQPQITGIDLLHNSQEYPFDVVLDAGYSKAVKESMLVFSKERSDVTFFIDEYDLTTTPYSQVDVDDNYTNVAVYSQIVTVSDVISGNEIWVTPSYFLSRLVAFNDALYGLQYPIAGLTRGVLTGAKGIDENPTPQQKDEFYNDRVNYIEKDSRGYRFMSQLTKTLDDTALKFLNNVRVTNRMVRDLERLGKQYLFEFNDATTLGNMRNALNRYVNDWIQNRTLSLANVTVEKNAFSDERVDVTLNIKFTGTIEIITIDITIE